MDTEAAADQQEDQGGGQHDVGGRHHVIGVAVVEQRERSDQQRVVRRVKIWKDDKSGGVRTRDLQLDLPLHRDVVDRRASTRQVELGRGIEVEEVGAPQVAADKREPVDRPEDEGTNPGTGGTRITKSNKAHSQTAVHRPLSRRRANRSGSFAFLIARWAPLMS